MSWLRKFFDLIVWAQEEYLSWLRKFFDDIENNSQEALIGYVADVFEDYIDGHDNVRRFTGRLLRPFFACAQAYGTEWFEEVVQCARLMNHGLGIHFDIYLKLLFEILRRQ